jgi:hypothetical protein
MLINIIDTKTKTFTGDITEYIGTDILLAYHDEGDVNGINITAYRDANNGALSGIIKKVTAHENNRISIEILLN